MQTLDTPLSAETLVAKNQSLLDEIWACFLAQSRALPVDCPLPLERPEFVRTELRQDTFDGSTSLFGEWRASSGVSQGNCVIHASGGVFAEYDIGIMHPEDPQLFVESATAWGQPGKVRGELRMIAALT